MLSSDISLATYQRQPIHYHTYTSDHGAVMLFVTQEGICGLHFLTYPQAYLIDSIYQKLGTQPQHSPDQVAPWWQRLHETGAKVPLLLEGTPFQLRVWEALCCIPRGEVRSYTTLAQEIGSPTSARAVARACSENIIACLIPCHRALRKNHEISGYRWGIDKKIALLVAEKAWPIP